MRKYYFILTANLAILGLLAFFSGRKYHDQSIQNQKVFYKPIAEFEKTEALIVSDILFEDYSKATDLIKAIISAGSQVVLILEKDLNDLEKMNFLISKGFSQQERQKILMINIQHENYWLRDFGPLPVKFFGFGDYQQLVFSGFVYRNQSKLDDTVTYQLGLFLTKSINHVPVMFDGGNFLTNGEDCFIAETIDDSMQNETIKRSYKEFDPHKRLKHLLRSRLGCRHIEVLEKSPHEHIDMFVKVVSKDTVFVNEIDEQTIAFGRKLDNFPIEGILELKENLDRLAAQLAKKMRVVRIPMPSPHSFLFRTYANGIIVNNHIIIPKYKIHPDTGKEYFDRHLLPGYERIVRDRFQEVGLKVVFIEADEIIRLGGALHCVTAHIPKSEDGFLR